VSFVVSSGVTVAVKDIRERRVAISLAGSERPVQPLMYDACAVALRVIMLGVIFVVPSA
jgi:hypothetical protein